MYYEYKFLVTNENLGYVKSILNSFYGNSDPFPTGEVDSIYYDTMDKACFEECLNGEPVKRKFRLRGYGGDEYFSLHQKRKDLSAVSKYKSKVKKFKKRAESVPNWDEIDISQDEMHPENFIKIKQLGDNYGSLYPSIRVKYKRDRFRTFDYRMTLDYQIEVSKLDNGLDTVKGHDILPWHVLEIKTTQENPILPFLGLIKLPQISFSKFYLGNCLLEGLPIIA